MFLSRFPRIYKKLNLERFSKGEGHSRELAGSRGLGAGAGSEATEPRPLDAVRTRYIVSAGRSENKRPLGRFSLNPCHVANVWGFGGRSAPILISKHPQSGFRLVLTLLTT